MRDTSFITSSILSLVIMLHVCLLLKLTRSRYISTQNIIIVYIIELANLGNTYIKTVTKHFIKNAIAFGHLLRKHHQQPSCKETFGGSFRISYYSIVPRN